MRSLQRLFKVNVEGVFLGSRAAARQMIAQGSGRGRTAGTIINSASTASRRAAAGVSAYCATTAPGFIRTDMWRDLAQGIAMQTGASADQVLAQFVSSVPWGRFGEPDEVAATVSWLASDEAEYINGQCISMNGAEMLF
jgi:meso-butanediol dehydrogenase/(S,S)-butanediol dehydrogenase/diacetyl reductase